MPRKKTPSPKGGNGDGRDPHTGRFRPGWAGGPGNPHAAQVGALRSALLGAVTEEDVRDVVEQLLALAKGGNLPAIKELLDRVVGKASQPIEAQVSQPYENMPETELVPIVVDTLLENEDRRSLLLDGLEAQGYRVQQAKRGKRKP